MRSIIIKEKYRPFSHVVGTSFIIPCSSWIVKVFPTRLEFSDLDSTKTHSVDLNIDEYVQDFLVTLDIERKAIFVYGKISKKTFCYKIFATNHAIEINPIKQPKKLFSKSVCFPAKTFASKYAPRLSFGIHKKQDLQAIWKRKNLHEILPILFAISRLYPNDIKAKSNLIKHLSNDHSFSIKSLLACLYEGFVPRLNDDDYQGIVKQGPESGSPLAIFSIFQSLIPSLFISKKGKTLEILNTSPEQFHSGRLINYVIDDLTISLYWTKKLLHSLEIISPKPQEIYLRLRLVKSCRFNHQKQNFANSIFLVKGKNIFDRFQK